VIVSKIRKHQLLDVEIVHTSKAHELRWAQLATLIKSTGEHLFEHIHSFFATVCVLAGSAMYTIYT
jgi:hypothetical protein